jgi:CRISPR-associated protein Cas2
MRRGFLVCYDIRDSKRLHKTHKLMKGYGTPWQYSVFYCVLDAATRVRMQSRLVDIIERSKDRVMILDMGDREVAPESITCIGTQKSASPRAVEIY